MRTSKIVALVATAALLVVASAFSVFAATVATGGTWDNSEGVWKYKTKSGEYLTQGWAKSGTDNFYLDENGEMAVSTLVDDGENLYFVDENGAMVKNKWEKVANTSDDGDEYYWYYFKSSGAAQKARSTNTPITVGDKKYLFDSDGKMLYGWINTSSGMEDNTDGTAFMSGSYYAGGQDDGAVRSAKWEKIAVTDARNTDSEDQEYWFYFQTSGLKVQSDDGDKLLEKSINGKKYAFDEYGVMKAEWAETTSISTASAIDNYAWYRLVTDAETGAKLKKGWFRVVPTASVSSVANADEEKHWFYAKGDGTLAKSEIRTIDGKKYGFNDRGEMLAGLYDITVDASDSNKITDVHAIDTASEVAKYQKTANAVNDPHAVIFFGDEETDGSAKTGTVATNIDGDDYKILFNATGANKYKAVQKVKSNCYYVNGFKVAADADCKYQAFPIVKGKTKFGTSEFKLADLNDDSTAYITSTAVPFSTVKTTSAVQYVLINSSGTIIKNSKKITDADGHEFRVENYQITYAQ